jgi:hypothetical protein
MIIDSPIISGSSAASGSLNQFGNVTITGSLTVTGAIIGAVTGSVDSASYASNAELLDGRDSTTFTSTSSFQNYTSSNDAQVLQLNNVSASFNSYTSSNNANIAALNAATASLYNATSSIYLATASIYLATASIYGATSSLFAYTASNSANVANLFATSASLNAAVADIRNATSSLYNATASIYGATSSLFNYSASSNLRIGSLEQYTASLNTRSASFACVTATNNFACTQYFSNASNAVSFTSTGSLYSDGGVRFTKDMYVSGTAFFNNVTVFGTQSVAYISSSQLNIGTNIISVNTDTPSIRFGGLAVYDSGSTSLTGSILWDSEDNQWIYSNPSGSTYDSAVFLVGPRNVGVLGNETGISCNFLSKGNGMHHMTSSGIFENGSTTCFYGNSFISSSGVVCFAGNTTLGGALQVAGQQAAANYGGTGLNFDFTSGNVGRISSVKTTSGGSSLELHTYNTSGNDVTALTISNTGAATFSSTVDGTIFNSTSNVFRFSGNNALSLVSLCSQNVVKINAAGYWGTQLVGANDQGILIDNSGNVGIGTLPSGRIHVASGNAHLNNYFTTGTSAGWDVKTYFTGGNSGSEQFLYFGFPGCTTDAFVQRGSNSRLDLGTSSTTRLSISATGAACFACELTAKTLGTNDLILNNLNYECANYVDGTRGSWLIQEGACDLFIINQVSCKKYKFNLIEIK